jgi:type II secretory pathway component GspD/PulD (secretin)
VFGLAIGAANLVANRLTAESRLISHSQLRATNGTPATLHVGERYPIINARFSPIAVDDDTQGAIDDGTFIEPVPSFTFEELGLVLEMTPQIHSAREVSVQFNVQFRVLTGSTANDIPVIANREFNSFARLREGEIAVIGGIALAQTFKVRTGVVGISEIPLLGNLFKRYTREKMTSDMIVLVRPYVVRLPPAEAGSTLTLMYGPEQRPLSGF